MEKAFIGDTVIKKLFTAIIVGGLISSLFFIGKQVEAAGLFDGMKRNVLMNYLSTGSNKQLVMSSMGSGAPDPALQQIVLDSALVQNNPRAQELINAQVSNSANAQNQTAQNAIVDAALGDKSKYAGQDYARSLVDQARASGMKPTAEQSQKFAEAAIKNNDQWAQQKILDSIKKGDVSAEDIQKLKDAAEKNGRDDFKRKIEEAEKNKNPNSSTPPTASKDKCVPVTPGMSSLVGKMYGEKGVKANNDKHGYKKEACAGCTECKKEYVTPRYEDVKEIPAEKCVYAVDAAGDEAKEGEIEDPDNFKIRQKQADLFKQEGNKMNMFTVTTDSNLNKLVAAAKAQIRPKENAEGVKNQSNESIERKQSEKGGGKVTTVIPDKQQHMEYWNESGSNKQGYTAGTGKEKIKAGAPYIVGITGNKDVNGKDIEVTEACDFRDNTQTPPSPPTNSNNNGGWPQNNNNGSNPGSGTPGGDQGGLLDKLLPALMQGLGSLGQGGGGNQGQNSNIPTPGTELYDCLNSEGGSGLTDNAIYESMQACSEDGTTYNNECIAEYQKQLLEMGQCVSDNIASTSIPGVDTLTSLIQQLAGSGIPDSLISSVTNVIKNFITDMISNASGMVSQ